MAATSSVAKSAQNASEIGWAFVPQYYTFVNKDPSRLHCFYTKRSTLIHSTEGEEANPCFGQQEIHEKFMSLSFDDCKVFVSNVDSQSSADGGIIVQVLGEMSNGAGPWRKFAQTFFLAEQPNGFFVLNDIFRYIKEEVDEGDEEPEAEPVTVTEDVAGSDTSMNVSGAAAPISSSQAEAPPVALPVAVAASHPTSPAPSYRSLSPLPAENRGTATSTEQSGPAQTFGSTQINGFHQDRVDVKLPEDVTEAVKPSVQPQEPSAPLAESSMTSVAATASTGPASVAGASSTAAPANPESAKKPDPHSSAPTQTPSTNGRSVSGQPKLTPAPASASAQPKPTEAPSQPAPPPAPKTWASLAASGKGAWGQGHLSSSQGVSSAPSAASQSVTDSQSQPVQQRTTGASHGNPADSVTTGACFIKSVHENLDEKTLKEQLVKKFGPIKELDIIRTKACGFLEFERIDAAKKAIQMSLPFAQGGKGGIPIVITGGEEFMIHIESKRLPGERGRPVDAGPKRGFSDRGGRPGSGFGASGARARGADGSRGSGRGGSRGGGGGRGMSHPNK